MVELIVSDGETKLVGVGGFPFMGKTRLTTSVASARPGDVQLLPVEPFVLSRAQRAAQAIDGCDPRAYELGNLRSALDALQRGERVLLRGYSWERGERTDEVVSAKLERGGAVLIDGTVCICEEVASRLSYNYFFQPADYQAWLVRAIHRDVTLRHWSKNDAEILNRRKYETARALFERHRRTVTHHYLVHMSDADFTYERLD